MIEMRWLERVVPVLDMPDICRIERVLQYRTINIFSSRSPNEWTDWQDVPTVKEGA